MQEKGIIFALSQVAYGGSLFLGYWAYFLMRGVSKSLNLFPFRYEFSNFNQIIHFQ